MAITILWLGGVNANMEQIGFSVATILVLILQGLVTLIVGLVGWWVKGISSQFRELNGDIRDLVAWKNLHQPQEEKWHEENRQDHRDIWKELKGLREDC